MKTLSCFYNDNKAFEMAEDYSNKYSINYDIFMRFRTDIEVNNFFNFLNFDKNILYCVKTPCTFTLAITDNPNGEFKNGRIYYYGNIKHNGLLVTGDIAYGTKELMRIYCNCYNYILEQNTLNNGNYFICFEYNLTTYLYDYNVNFNFFNYDYKYDTSRFIKDRTL